MHHHALIERFALWDAPAIVILLTAPAAMVVVIIRFTKPVRWRLNYEALTESDRFWKALKLLLPLAALPILFVVLVIPEFIFHIYDVMEVMELAVHNTWENACFNQHLSV